MQPRPVRQEQPEIELVTGGQWRSGPLENPASTARRNVGRTQAAILADVVELVAARMGKEELAGLSLQQWFDGRTVTEVDEILPVLEDLSPQIGVQIRQLIGSPPGDPTEPQAN